jgi:hypothetical protein
MTDPRASHQHNKVVATVCGNTSTSANTRTSSNTLRAMRRLDSFLLRTWMATSVILLQRFYERTCVHSYGHAGGESFVLLPKGCVTSACAFQTKSLLPSPGSATLSYMVKFGPNFDSMRWKLPVCVVRNV